MISSEALRFALVGTHHAGKTTICHDVTARLRRLGIDAAMASEPSRASRYLAEGARGIPTQVDLFASTIVNEMEAARQGAVVVCDRSLVDVLAYTDVLPRAGDANHRLLAAAMLAFADKYLSTYTTFFKTSWRFPMEDSDDPLRAGDDTLQRRVDDRIEHHLARLELPVVPLADPDTAAEEIGALIVERLRGGREEEQATSLL